MGEAKRRQKANQGSTDHYVPQFYLQRFALHGGTHVPVITRPHRQVITDEKAISGIGFEEDLHALQTPTGSVSFETIINKRIETPFTNTDTWQKIVDGRASELGASDKLNLYLLIRHLQARNIASLRFLEEEARRVRDRSPGRSTSPLDRAFDDYLRSILSPHAAFVRMASSLRPFLARYDEASIAIVHTNERLRTSTNPVLPIPRTMGGFDLYSWFDEADFVVWLPLGPYVGAMLTVSGRFSNFSSYDAPPGFARMINQLYIVQFLDPKSHVRYCIADDDWVEDDLAWAYYKRLSGDGNRPRYEQVREVKPILWSGPRIRSPYGGF